MLRSFTILGAIILLILHTAHGQIYTVSPFKMSYFQPNVGLNIEPYFNGQDIIMSFGVGLEEKGYDFSSTFNVGFRPYLKKVRIQEEENLFYQYRERVLLFSLDIEKQLYFLEYAKGDYNNHIGLYAKAKLGYMHANYRGLSESLKNGFTVAPGAGLAWDMKNARLSAGYLLFDQQNNIPNGMIDIMLTIYLNNKNDE